MTETRAVRLSSRAVFRGRVFEVLVDRVRLRHGREVDLEVVRHPSSVVLIPMPDPDHVVLVRQYRYAIAQWIWELPAGSVDPGETLDAAARRECHEEIGRLPVKLERTGAFYPTPGYCDELMIYYRVDGLEDAATAAAVDEDEDLEPRVFRLAEARRMVDQGEILDMKTVVGLRMI